MVQILPPKTSLGNTLGQALGSGLSSGMETGIQRGNLQSAFDKLQPGGNFTEQLKQIAPILLSTPGGAQALAELSPILGQQSQNAAYIKSVQDQIDKNSREGAPTGPQPVPQGQQPQPGQSQQGEFRRPRAPASATTTFPEITAGPQTTPEMSPSQLRDYALNLMKNSGATGSPIPYDKAMNDAIAQNNIIRSSNSQIQQEKETRDKAQKVLSQNIVARAANNDLIKDPEDATVAEKFALEARNAPNANAAWEHVRTQMRAYDNAKATIRTTLGLGNPLTNAYRKLNGTYKDQEQIIKDIQKPLDFFRQHGLYDEAKDVLVNDLGFGNEQAHAAVFPFSKEEKGGLEVFPKRPAKKVPFSYTTQETQFPGEDYSLPADGFNKFKDHLAEYLNENKDVDLVTLRGNLNQDKKYAWQDIYKGIDQLIDERRFSPDLEQEKQLNTIRQAPTPGLGAYFQYLWTGKK